MERFNPFQQSAVLFGTLVRIRKVGRKAPVDPSLLDASGVVPFQLFAEIVLLLDIVSLGEKQIKVVVAVLAGDLELRPQFVTARL